MYTLYTFYTPLMPACLPADPSKCFCSRWSFMRIFYFKSGINVWFKWHAHFTIQVKPRKKEQHKTYLFSAIHSFSGTHFSSEWMPEMHSQTMEENEIIAMEKIIFEIMLHGISIQIEIHEKKILIYFHALWTTKRGDRERVRQLNSLSCLISFSIIIKKSFYIVGDILEWTNAYIWLEFGNQLSLHSFSTVTRNIFSKRICTPGAMFWNESWLRYLINI